MAVFYVLTTRESPRPSHTTSMDSTQTDGDYTLRWATTHVFGDTVRHAGQADILRELTDGKRGW